MRSRFLEVLHLSAHKQGFGATRRDVVIEPGNVGVEAAIHVWREAKSQSIRTIAGGAFIGPWILIENVQNRLIHADSERVHGFDLVRSERIVTWLDVADAVDGAAGTTGILVSVQKESTFVYEIARAQSRAGDEPQCAAAFGVAPPFIVAEEEETILHDRPADRGAEYVAQELRRRVGLAVG